jgi:uncharacterized membrane protein
VKVPRWLRIVGWIFLIFLIYAIFRSPEGAADLVVGGVEGIGAGFGAIFTFFDAVLGRLGDDGVTALGMYPILIAS